MSYFALYRKYRPSVFDEVTGQDHVVTTLRNQVRSDRVAHAYLFTGARGTGKTSVAKIFAKAVNCEHPVDGNPCGTCASCLAIQKGNSMNVAEIDAASNNSVENVRTIREEVSYRPAEGRYRVYIIDEAHMLSGGAFNALLKTLEEPPGHVIFILATTEAQKIPVTILSRCQRYDFRRISQEEIAGRLRDLFARENVTADEKAIRFIAGKADGGMRDALSLADQCIAFYLGETLTYERVLDVLGAVDTQVLGQLFRSICQDDVASVFSQLDELIYKGRDLAQLAADFTEYLRDLLLLKSVKRAEDILEVPEDALALLREEAELAGSEKLLRDIRIMSELSAGMRFAASKRVLLEVAMIRLCKPQMDTDVTSLSVRLSSLEERIENGLIAFNAGRPGNRPGGGPDGQGGWQEGWPGGSPDGQGGWQGGWPGSPDGQGGWQGNRPGGGTGGAPGPGARRKELIYGKCASEELRLVDEQWNDIIEPLRKELCGKVLKTARRMFDTSGENEDVLYLSGSNILIPELAGAQEQIKKLEDLIEARIGKRIRVRVISGEQEQEAGQSLEEIRKSVQDILGMPVDIANE